MPIRMILSAMGLEVEHHPKSGFRSPGIEVWVVGSLSGASHRPNFMIA
jgi:hypothetical protein